VLEGVRARAEAMATRHKLIVDGRSLWAGKRVLFVLPATTSGGGANVVIAERKAMQAMEVDVCILNLNAFRRDFELGYPELTMPVIYAENEESIPALILGFDAVVATACHSVYWLQSRLVIRVPPSEGTTFKM